jgi:cytidylate kinase
MHQIAERKKSENKRYKELYGADCSDLNQYDLVVDTSFITPEQVAEVILDAYRQWLQK